jgi:hypothetical protein
VAFDLKVPTLIAGCKASGLICKLVSTPLWNLLENKTINILEMNRYYLMGRHYNLLINGKWVKMICFKTNTQIPFYICMDGVFE